MIAAFLANWTACGRRSEPCSVARHQSKDDGEAADKLNGRANGRQHLRDSAGYAVPRQAGGECIEAHEFLKPALNENTADQNPSEQPDDVAPRRGGAVDPRLTGNGRAAGTLIGTGSTRYGAHGLSPMRSAA